MDVVVFLPHPFNLRSLVLVQNYPMTRTLILGVVDCGGGGDVDPPPSVFFTSKFLTFPNMILTGSIKNLAKSDIILYFIDL